MLYLMLKSLHIMTVIIWMGGMVLLSAGFLWLRGVSCPRSERDTAILAAIKQWDTRVTSPAMGLAWLFGLAVAWEGEWFSQPWLHAKLAVVILLSALHGNLSGTVRRLANEPDRIPPGFLSYSGMITIASIVAIVFLVVLKPF